MLLPPLYGQVGGLEEEGAKKDNEASNVSFFATGAFAILASKSIVCPFASMLQSVFQD